MFSTEFVSILCSFYLVLPHSIPFAVYAFKHRMPFEH